jgi:hypothetical protein
MGIKFRVFSFRDTKPEQIPERSLFLGIPTGKTLTQYVSAYANTHALYQAAADFAASVGGRLVAITGTPWGESTNSYTAGEVVVWYREAEQGDRAFPC